MRQMMSRLTVKDAVEVMAGVMRVSPQLVLCRTRQRPFPLCRYLIADTLRQAGASTLKLEGLMGINHATLIHGAKVVDTVRLGWATPEEYDIYDRYKIAINQKIRDNAFIFTGNSGSGDMLPRNPDAVQFRLSDDCFWS